MVILTFIFDIADLMSRKKQVSGLLHAEAIVLKDRAREDDML